MNLKNKGWGYLIIAVIIALSVSVGIFLLMAWGLQIGINLLLPIWTTTQITFVQAAALLLIISIIGSMFKSVVVK